MRLTTSITFFLVILAFIGLMGCSQRSYESQNSNNQQPYQAPNNYQNPVPIQKNCDSTTTPSLSVTCKKSGVYQEFNVNTGRNEYKDKYSCYGRPSGQSGVMYRVWSYDSQGGDLGGGDIGSGGSVKVAVNADFVEVFPNLDGNFCRNRITRISKNQFTYEKDTAE